MQNHSHTWHPFASVGLKSNFWTLQADTLIATWVILAFLCFLSLYISRCLKNEKSLVRWIVLQFIKAFKELIEQSIGSCPPHHLAMIASLFTFIFFCNTIQWIPWLEEPTKDLNTTFALGLISFFYVQSNSIKAKGLKHYIMHYFEPFILMFPLHLIGTVSSVISISFRLFGNIFGGFIISSLYGKVLSGSIIAQTFGLLLGTNMLMLLLFGIFEGLIQAFVFTMLTLTYLSMAVVPDDSEQSTHPHLTS